MRLVRPFLLTLALVGVACGGSSLGDGDGDGGVNNNNNGDGGDDSCMRASNCPNGQICDPNSNLCVDPPGCTTNAECGNGAICNSSGVCEENTTGGQCDDQTDCPSMETCIGGFCGCAGDAFEAEAVPPNVLIVLDKSGSMDDPPTAGGSQTKFEIAQDAIATLLTNYGATVRFGLSLYPSDNSCGAGNIDVGVGMNTASMINSDIAAVASAGPNGSTPIGDSLDGYTSYAGLQDTTRENYILLITDGEETCSGDGEGGAAALFAQTPPVRTFVVGFGDGVDPAALNDMAVAGDTALPGGPPYYYQADNAVDLNMALDDIGGAVLSCTYTLSGMPDSADDVYVRFDGTEIPRDQTMTDGWDYDPGSGQITFYGPACDSLRAGTVTDLVIVNACSIDVP